MPLKLFYACPSSYSRRSMFSIFYLLIGILRFILGIMMILWQNLDYKWKYNKPLSVSMNWDKHSSNSGGVGEVFSDGEQKRYKLEGFLGIQTGCRSAGGRPALQKTWFPSDHRDASLCSSSGNSSLASCDVCFDAKEDSKGKPTLDCISKDLPSSNKSNHEAKLAVENLPTGQPDLEDILNISVPERVESKGCPERVESKGCHINDDDLLILHIKKKKTIRSSERHSTHKSKPLRKHKKRKGMCSGAKNLMEKKWSTSELRTVLSWLIHSGVLSLNEVVQLRNLKNDVVKDGLITRGGILCNCCNMVLSISEFKSHAGFGSKQNCINLFLESGKPLTSCQLEAWSAEYKARIAQTGQVDKTDPNDDCCGRCGDVGQLICCDSCPSAFHQSCLFEQVLPKGSWYCPQCCCLICGDVVNDKDASQSHSSFQCSQCENKYHRTCMQRKGLKMELTSDTLFCGERCQEVYSGLHSRIGVINCLSDGYCWTLLQCINGEQKVHPDKCLVALKAECNSKLAVAITILEECFLSMVDPKTGINMIPQVMYNWGSEFARLNYSGFYTVVLEKDDIVLSVASIRIHGDTVAELPLVATCSKYRRKGLCRLLINSIEEMLESLKVKKLVVSAVPSVVETWTKGFGFEPLEDDERRSFSKINFMVFPGSVWLKKPLYQSTIDQENEATHTETESLCAHSENLNPSISSDEQEGIRLRSRFVCSRSQNRDRNQKWR